MQTLPKEILIKILEMTEDKINESWKEKYNKIFNLCVEMIETSYLVQRKVDHKYNVIRCMHCKMNNITDDNLVGICIIKNREPVARSIGGGVSDGWNYFCKLRFQQVYGKPFNVEYLKNISRYKLSKKEVINLLVDLELEKQWNLKYDTLLKILDECVETPSSMSALRMLDRVKI